MKNDEIAKHDAIAKKVYNSFSKDSRDELDMLDENGRAYWLFVRARGFSWNIKMYFEQNGLQVRILECESGSETPTKLYSRFNSAIADSIIKYVKNEIKSFSKEMKDEFGSN